LGSWVDTLSLFEAVPVKKDAYGNILSDTRKLSALICDRFPDEDLSEAHDAGFDTKMLHKLVLSSTIIGRKQETR